MRHGVKGRKLSRTAAHRKATMQSLAMALIREHRIVTTLEKAKELRGFVEPLITRAKEDTHHNRRQVFSTLQNKESVNQLFNEVGPQSKDRPGGYTRVIKAGFRKGDGAELAVIELVDFNDIKPEGSSNKASGKKRTRRAGKSNAPTTSAAPDKEESKSEAVKEDDAVEVTEVTAEAEEVPAEEDIDAQEEVKAEEADNSDESAEEEKK